MLDMNCPDVDLVTELQLRSWARENFLPADERSNSLHPIVLNEMRLKDVELEKMQRGRLMDLSYVPLVPSGYHFAHAGHPVQGEPKTSHRPADVTSGFLG